jgi:hypothetical protein
MDGKAGGRFDPGWPRIRGYRTAAHAMSDGPAFLRILRLLAAIGGNLNGRKKAQETQEIRSLRQRKLPG